MLYFDRIVSEDIDGFVKMSNQKKCVICQYWYFLGNGFNFQPDVCNRRNDVLMMSVNFSDMLF